MGSLPQRIKDKIRVVPVVGGCWEWVAYVSRDGYGQAWIDGRGGGAHRAVYSRLVGPIGEGLEIDHLCRNRRCVNPSHLEAVTHTENQRRGVNGRRGLNNKKKTHCKFGHAFDEINTRKLRNGGRQCKKCCASRERERQRKLRASSAASR